MIIRLSYLRCLYSVKLISLVLTSAGGTWKYGDSDLTHGGKSCYQTQTKIEISATLPGVLMALPQGAFKIGFHIYHR